MCMLSADNNSGDGTPSSRGRLQTPDMWYDGRNGSPHVDDSTPQIQYEPRRHLHGFHI